MAIMTLKPKPTLEDRLYKNMPIEDSNKCWNWSGYKITSGYGGFFVGVKDKRKFYLAHRLSYEHFVGPIPEKFVIDHLCRNPSCINPTHLEAVTHAVNVQRGKMSRYWPTCNNGHAWDEETKFYRVDGSVTCRICKRINERKRGPAKRARAKMRKNGINTEVNKKTGSS